MPAQNSVAHGVKRSAPQGRQFLTKQIRHAPHHLASGFVGKSQQENALWRNPLLEQIGYTVSQRARLTRTGAGNDQRRPWWSRHRSKLLFVELLRVVNLQMD